MGGSSVTAGHDNLFSQSFSHVLGRTMSPLLDAAGVELIVRNSAMGGTSDMPYSYCAARHLGEDADLVVWEWMMFQGPCDQSGFTCSKEIYLRQAFMQCNRAATTLFRYGDPREPNRDANESSIQDLNMDQVWDEDAGFWQDYRWITEKYGSVGAIALDIRPIVESRDNQEKWSKEKWWLADKIGPGAANLKQPKNPCGSYSPLMRVLTSDFDHGLKYEIIVQYHLILI